MQWAITPTHHDRRAPAAPSIPGHYDAARQATDYMRHEFHGREREEVIFIFP